MAARPYPPSPMPMMPGAAAGGAGRFTPRGRGAAGGGVPRAPRPAAASVTAPAPAAAQSTTICVANIPDDLAEREFRLMFKFAWGFERASINRTKQGHQVGYARFSALDQAEAALLYLNGYVFDEDYPIQLKCFMSTTQLSDELLDARARAAGVGMKRNYGAAYPAYAGAYGGNPMQPKRRQLTANPLSVYVGGIPHDWDENQITALFSPYGSITGIQLTQGRVQEVGNIAFIFYATPEEAQTAIDAMNNYAIDNAKHLVVRHNTSNAGRRTEGAPAATPGAEGPAV